MRRCHQIAFCIVLFLAGCSRPSLASAETIAHPDNGAARVEYFVSRPSGNGPWPTIIFLHGYQPPDARPGGRAFVDWGVLDRFAKKGYVAASVSLPGYGGSGGPEDFAGPFTQHAVEVVITTLVAEGDASRDKVLIQGVSLGAVTAALVAAHDPNVAGLVLISGLYDFPAYFAHPSSLGALGVESRLIAQTGGGEDALRSRSALLLAPDIKASTLILNGAQDDRTDPEQARRFAQAILAHGGRARVHIYEQFGHEIPVKAREPEIDAFIDETLKH
jgi:dipeptidyl aminopeptidase/acylaminoacyl peptidase